MFNGVYWLAFMELMDWSYWGAAFFPTFRALQGNECDRVLYRIFVALFKKK